MIGSNIVYYPDQFTAVFQSDHDIAVHTWTHPYMTTLNNLDVLSEVSYVPWDLRDGRFNLSFISLDGRYN